MIQVGGTIIYEQYVITFICTECGAEDKKLPGNKNLYCSHECHRTSQYKQYIGRWKAGLEHGMKGRNSISNHIRRYLFEKFDSKCSQCGWNRCHPDDGRIPLDVEHIDGDGTNNKEDNLDLLCPGCHSLTSTYKNRNKGKSTRKYK